MEGVNKKDFKVCVKGKHIKINYGKYFKRVLPFFILIVNSIYAQDNAVAINSIADSLYKSGNQKIKKGIFKEALQDFTKSLELSKKENNNALVGDCFSKIAISYYYQGKYNDAFEAFDESITYYQLTDNKKGLASSFNNQGAIYYYLGNYPKALDQYKKALQIQEKLEDTSQIAGTTKNIGSIYMELQDYESAKSHFELSKKLYTSVANEKPLIQVLNGLGEMYLRDSKFEEAQENFETALELTKKFNDERREVEVLFNLGKLYYKKQDYTKALSFYNESLTKASIQNNALYESSAIIAIGTLQEQKGEVYAAMQKCKEGLQIATKLKVISIQEEACKCLYNAYKSANKNKDALLYLEKMHLLKDSLNLKQTSDKILKMKFEKEMLLDSIANVEKERIIQLAHKEEVAKKEKQRNMLLVTGAFIILIAVALWSRLNFTKKAKARLQVEKDRSEHLLHNILPEEVADELKENGYVKAQDFEKASILFTDFKSFTQTASLLTPQELVEEINECFKAFDLIMGKYGLEKIKTIGDAYMAAGGLPKPDANAVKKMILAGLEMQDFIKVRKRENQQKGKPAFDMRVGIHVGPIVAGVVGVKKFQYDIWGDTVNTASRMESNGAIEKVNISSATYELVKHDEELTFEYRGAIEAKGKGALEMYFVSLKSSKSVKKIQKNNELQFSQSL
ncbi:class 3 adenylate cyclase [Tenacibaculum skagerrakense]|uniref:Class 3 adenylate cyclase n=1 Tax=Tenacibaculum skagerrakense TaxID=186571 RepID=A0A4R2NRC3_9FLAO|nr:adenylate/guanylate cyclase domain-containing protein [Tenacibaculum skagerrakense]TCP24021.1 class 3 adenylate cyclase [Tenacibaculum skagerrakense]